jgi:LuxR family quorum sensing-dependent transcriptional regulator
MGGRANFAFDVIDAIERVRTPNDLLGELARAASHFGFESCGIASLPDQNLHFERYAYVYRWPLGWFERYVENNYIAADPVIRRIRSSVRPFAWNEAPLDRSAEPLAARVMDEATEFGLNAGFCVPVYTLTGELVTVTFGGECPEFTAQDRPALHLVAIYAHAKVRDLLGRRPSASSIPKLSSRELEVLKWCSAGKTSREIADILLISETTVITHIRNACVKLDVATRTQAVATAIRARLIT